MTACTETGQGVKQFIKYEAHLRITQKVSNILRHIKQLAILCYNCNESIESLKMKNNAYQKWLTNYY